MEYRDGKVVRGEFEGDSAKALKALGYNPEQILEQFFSFDTFHITKKGIEFEVVPGVTVESV